jgi:DNA-binding transcriptional MerR regulator
MKDGLDPARGRFSTAEAVKEIGVSKATLLRWFREQRVPDVERDRNGWRVFSQADINRLTSFARGSTRSEAE